MAKKKRGSVKIPDARKLFIHAEGFRLTSDLLRAEVSAGKDIYLFAFHANDAFCCELFLKCLAAIRAREHPPGHKLDELFDALPEPDQDRVEYHYERLSASDPKHASAGSVSPSQSNSLRAVLKDGADLFERIRYWYEGNFPHRRGDFKYPILAIRETILEIHQHWTPNVENWTKPKPSPRQKLK